MTEFFDELITNISTSWSDSILGTEPDTWVSEIKNRWLSEEADPIPSGLELIDDRFTWAQHLEMFFLVPTGDNLDILKAQNKFRQSIVTAFNETKDEFEQDIIQFSDILTLRWGRRCKNLLLTVTEIDRAQFQVEKSLAIDSYRVIVEAIGFASLFQPRPIEDDYRFQNEIALLILDTLATDALDDNGLTVKTTVLGTFFDRDDYHLFRRGALDYLDSTENLKAQYLQATGRFLSNLIRSGPELVLFRKSHNHERTITGQDVGHLKDRYERILDHVLVAFSSFVISLKDPLPRKADNRLRKTQTVVWALDALIGRPLVLVPDFSSYTIRVAPKNNFFSESVPEELNQNFADEVNEKLYPVAAE